MIIVNGTVSAKDATGGGLDESGNPSASKDTWGAAIPCNISINKLNNLGRQDGNTFTIASYEILVEEQPFEAGSVWLTERGRDLGEFSVMFTERLEAVGATKIVV
jgi:hypothetical protein